MSRVFPCLGQGTVVPDVAMVWKAVADVAKFAFLDVLFDGVELVRCVDLCKIDMAPDPSTHVVHAIQSAVLVSSWGQ